jgi:hypothetical protein
VIRQEAVTRWRIGLLAVLVSLPLFAGGCDKTVRAFTTLADLARAGGSSVRAVTRALPESLPRWQDAEAAIKDVAFRTGEGLETVQGIVCEVLEPAVKTEVIPDSVAFVEAWDAQGINADIGVQLRAVQVETAAKDAADESWETFLAFVTRACQLGKGG